MTTPKIKRKMVRIAASNLRIHPTAQRDLVQSKLRKLTANLDLDAIGVLQAIECSIDGVRGTWVIDGQHRLRALLDNDMGDWEVDVCIHIDVQDAARASEVFLKLNDRAVVAPYDKFVNRITANDPVAVGIIQCLSARQLNLSRQSTANSLCCIHALTSSYEYDGGVSLSKSLDTILTAWGRNASGLEGKIVAGLSLVFKTYNGTLDQPALVKKLAKYPGGASALLGDAKGMMRLEKAPLTRLIARKIVDLYNVGKRTERLDPL